MEVCGGGESNCTISSMIWQLWRGYMLFVSVQMHFINSLAHDKIKFRLKGHIKGWSADL